MFKYSSFFFFFFKQIGVTIPDVVYVIDSGKVKETR